MFAARHWFSFTSLFKLVNLAELMNEEATQQLQCVCVSLCACCYSAEGHAHTHTHQVLLHLLWPRLCFLDTFSTLTAHPLSRDDSSGPLVSAAAAGRKHRAKPATFSLLTAGCRSQQSVAPQLHHRGALFTSCRSRFLLFTDGTCHWAATQWSRQVLQWVLETVSMPGGCIHHHEVEASLEKSGCCPSVLHRLCQVRRGGVSEESFLWTSST